jgi:hypothetical protein
VSRLLRRLSVSGTRGTLRTRSLECHDALQWTKRMHLSLPMLDTDQ